MSPISEQNTILVRGLIQYRAPLMKLKMDKVQKMKMEEKKGNHSYTFQLVGTS
jgi:hypothetical protein